MGVYALGVIMHSSQVPDRGLQLLWIVWVLTTLAIMTAVLRIYSRFRNRLFGWDDMFMVFSTFCLLCWGIILTIHVGDGGLRHMSDVQEAGPDHVAKVKFLLWLAQVFGVLGIAAGKISIAALILAIIELTELRWQRAFLWVVPIFLSGMLGITCALLMVIQCSPVEALWDSRIHGKCINPDVMPIFCTFTGASNTFTDMALSVIPATIFCQLRSSKTQKAQLSIVFGLNILTSLCSGVKTRYLYALAKSADQTWSSYHVFVWLTAELFFTIVCGSIPTLHLVVGWFKIVAGGIRTPIASTPAASRPSSPRGSSPKRRRGLRSRAKGPGSGSSRTFVAERSFSNTSHLKTTTTTIIESVGRSRNQSVDHLVDGAGSGGGMDSELLGYGVRVETEYDVRSNTRPNSMVSEETTGYLHLGI